jgi:DNA-binding phage protein
MEALSPVKRYNLAPPTEQDVIVSLSRLFKPEEVQQLWTAARSQAGLRSKGAPLTMDQLANALQQLKLSKGLAAVAASSLLVRVKSYHTLSHLNSK